MKRYLNDLEHSVLSMMIEKLDDMEGRDGYVSDLAFDLFESENIDSSITYCTYKAVEWIMEHFHDLGDMVEEIQDEGGITANPFSNPEKFMVQVVLYLAETLIDQSPYLARGLYDEEIDCITYDAETLEVIRREWQEALYR